MRLIQFITSLQAALHVSGVDTHHQELANTNNYILVLVAAYFIHCS